MTKWKTKTLIAVLIVCLFPISVYAQSSSNNYSIDEYFIGPGGDNDLNSSSYSARASLGDTGIGNSASTNYQLYGGFTTTQDPYIELVIDAGTVDMGVLDGSTTGTGTGTFSVRTYLAEGYIVTAAGTAPTMGSEVIDPMTTRGPSVQGVEQFGINLTANTSPATFGADPVQVPSSDFSFGAATVDYSTTNEYKWIHGDTVASSNKSSGQTDYTVSYIMNVSDLTPAGYYIANTTFVATSTY